MLLNSLQCTGQLQRQRTIQTKMPVTQNDQIRTHMTQTFLTHVPSLHPHFQVYMLLRLLSRFSHVRLCATPQTAAHQALPPWDSPDKNTGVGCHFLLQCMTVKSESEVAQSCPTLNDHMDCSLPGSSVHGIFQARVLEWGAIAFSPSLHAICIQN